jgi:putative Holliday junction resolvase
MALDIGDVWTGSAISDALGMFARPYQTVESSTLEAFISITLKKENIATIIVGYPKTMRGTKSEQTEKLELLFEHLKKTFPTISWLLWDERLSSKRADQLKKGISKEDKKQSHSLAAAFILSSYLDYQHMQKDMHNS